MNLFLMPTDLPTGHLPSYSLVLVLHELEDALLFDEHI